MASRVSQTLPPSGAQNAAAAAPGPFKYVGVHLVPHNPWGQGAFALVQSMLFLAVNRCEVELRGGKKMTCSVEFSFSEKADVARLVADTGKELSLLIKDFTCGKDGTLTSIKLCRADDSNNQSFALFAKR